MTTKTEQGVLRNGEFAIVGMSALFPKAANLKAFWKVLRLGVDTIGDIPSTHWKPEDYFDADQKAPDKTYCRRGGFLDPYPFDPTEFSMPPTVLEATDTSQLLGLVAAKAALEDAGYTSEREFDREMTSIILGVTGTLELVVPLGARLGHPYWRKALQESGLSDDLVEEVMTRISADYVPWQENSFPGLLGNVVAGRIANRLDLHGTNCVVDAACASTLSAAHLALLELETGQADMVITGGVDTFNDIFMYMCFSKTPALSASGQIRPFDAQGDGTLIGEGIGMVVLKRLADAQRDKDRIYAVIRGVGTSSDGKEKAVYAPFSPGQARALRRAYENAGVSPRTIELVEAHGTGTKVGDVVEFEALKGVYAEASPDQGWCALGSVKSQIGHTKAAAGSAGMIKAALALHHKVLPPTINISRPNPKLGVEESAFYLNTLSRPWISHPEHPRRAALSSFGFGGSNFHIVLEEYGAARTEVAWDGSVEIAAFSGSSQVEIARAVKNLLEGPGDLSHGLYQNRKTFEPKAPHRLIVPAQASQMKEALTEALQALEGGQRPNFYGEGPVQGKLAFLFPGQGSQYVNMGRDLACLFPEMLESLDSVGREVGQAIYPPPTQDSQLEKAQQDYLTSTDRAQPALGVIERGYFHLLQRFGLTPEGTAGHSYGELVALYAAGVLDGQGLAELSAERGRLMAQQGEDLGTMMAVKGSLEKVEKVLKESGTSVVLANRNSPEQCVLSGSEKDLKALAPELKKAGLKGVPLKVGAAFHSPFVAGARDPFHQVASKVKFHKSEIPVYANKTASPYPKSGKAARALLADQLVHQVNFVELIETMASDGFTTFVEVGPKTVLGGLVKAILAESQAAQVVSLDASAGRSDALLDLSKALAQLAAWGWSVDLGAWETEPVVKAKQRMTVEISGANYRSKTPVKPPIRIQGSVGTRDKGAALPTQSSHLSAKVTERVSAPTQAAAPQPPSAPIAEPGPSSRSMVNAAAPQGGTHADSRTSANVGQPSLGALLPHFEALQELSRQTAQVHQQFLKSQEAAQRTLGQLLSGAGERPSLSLREAAPQPVRSVPQSWPVSTSRPLVPVSQAPSPPPRPMPIPAVAVVAEEVKPAVRATTQAPPKSETAPARSASPEVSQALLKVVAEKTGYPVEMLTLDMDLEGDLGIDSIKRVEILAAVEEAIPNLPKVDSDRLGSLRTLSEIVAALGSAAPSTLKATGITVAPMAQGNPEDARVSQALLEVVAEKTGYPVEMLTLEMDLEGDLGIDSIKRVEILAAVEEAIPGLPKVDSDRLGSLRSLGEIVGALAPAGAVSPSALTPTQESSSDSGATAQALMHVVADKTGYPAEMLTLEMDLESDLGIDSIKRVEILAAVEEAVPGLPKIDSERLGSLRTLGEIVSALGSGTPTPVAASAPPSLLVSKGGQGGEAASSALLKVVAEKTGYPAEMLTLEMDLESDLGIDSIKRVEILAAVEEAVPGMPKIDSEVLGSLRTLAEIVAALGSTGATPSREEYAPSVSNASGGAVSEALLEVVSEKTGYPLEMLTLDMDLEGDLGIDSIKRVEILAAVEEAVPNLPKLDSDRMGSLRTLGEIVEALSLGSGPVVGPSLASSAHAGVTPAAKISRQALQLVDVGPGDTVGLPVAEGRRLVVIEDTPGLGQTLVEVLESRGVYCSLWGAEEPLPEDLGTLVLVGNGGQGERSREFLFRAFQRVREASQSLRTHAGGLFTVTTLDGSFGLKGKTFDPFIGGLAGIPKTVAHEWPEVVTRAIDRHPDLMVDEVAEELFKDGPVEVALTPGRRETLVTMVSDSTEGTPYLGADDVVLVTGGARGVTAACALAVAAQHRCKFALLGRTKLEGPSFSLYPDCPDEASLKRTILAQQFSGKAKPKELEEAARKVLGQREIRQSLDGLKALGVQAEYLACDVRDKEQLSQAIKEITASLGRPTGLIHGAGVLADRKIEDKTDQQFQQVFETKVKSLVALTELLPDLKALVLFSSVTARFGRPGQIDYCMANEVLNKYAQFESRRRPRCKVVAMGWGPWAGGMVTPALAREFERIGVGLIPIELGAKAVADELAQQGGSAHAEVLFGDGFPEPAPTVRRTKDHSDGSGKLLLQKTLSVKTLPFLDSHRLGGDPVLPMAMMQEWFVQGALHGGTGLRLIGIDDLRVFRGAVIRDGVEPTLVVTAQEGQMTSQTGNYRWTLELRDISRNILHARATVVLGDALPEQPEARELNGIASNAYGHDSESIYSNLLFHGTDFHAVSEVSGISDRGLAALLKVAKAPAHWEAEPLRSDWVTEPLVVDGVLQLGILWSWENLGKPSLPNGFARYRQYVRRFPKKPVTAILRVTSSSERSVVADCELRDEKGRVLATFEKLDWTADEGLKAAFGLPSALASRS